MEWVRMTSKLRQHFGSLEKAADYIGVTGAALRDLDRKAVKNPRFSTGIIILVSYVKLFPEEIEQIRKDVIECADCPIAVFKPSDALAYLEAER